VLNSTLDLDKLFEIILRMASDHTGAERATLFMLDRDRQELWSLLAQGLEQREIRLPVGKGLAGWVAETGEVVSLSDAYDDPRFDARFDQLFHYRTRAVLVMPVKDRLGNIVGVLELLNKRGARFTKKDVDLLESISVHVAIALDNARLHRELMERQRLDRDLALARTIQKGLLPEAPPVLDGFDIAIRHETSFLVGGDYYDFLRLDDTTHLFVVADVEGKGPSSALVMSNLQATLHTLARHVHSLEGIMFNLNEAIQRTTRGEKYMTVFLGLLDTRRRGLHYINAGHLPPVVVREDGPVFLKEGGLVIGLIPRTRYTRGFLPLNSGDVVLACTDGIAEANNRNEEQYGVDRMVASASANRSLTAREIVDGIFKEAGAFSAGGTHEDDKVLMAIRVL
jgi:sigma-B regulation protein RsbU (phosphoserine phosphatase)